MLRIVSFKIEDEHGRTKDVDYDGLRELLHTCQFDNASMTNGRVSLKKGTTDDTILRASFGSVEYIIEKAEDCLNVITTTSNSKTCDKCYMIDSVKDIVKTGRELVLPISYKGTGLIFAECTQNGIGAFSCTSELGFSGGKLKLKSLADTGIGSTDFIYEDSKTGKKEKFRYNRHGFPRIQKVLV